MTARAVSSQLEVAVDAQTAFRAFTAEMDLWWVRGPINFFDVPLEGLELLGPAGLDLVQPGLDRRDRLRPQPEHPRPRVPLQSLVLDDQGREENPQMPAHGGR